MTLNLLTDDFGSFVAVFLGPLYTAEGYLDFFWIVRLIVCFKHYNYQEESMCNLDFAAKEREVKEEKQSGRAFR